MSESVGTIVETSAGKVEGVDQNNLRVFKGIPYAAPPVGDRRWLPPAPVDPWSGVRQVKAFGATAPQNRLEIDILKAFQVEEPQSEDCLYLNVWTPGLDDARRPVLFWIHGGGFTSGSGSQPVYEGSTLSGRGNAVVVTANYRLGPLGFLNLSEVTGGKIPATGNEGLLDQIAALEWVRDNIAAFGGDPGNVTIFGESAGGMSVGSLLAMPKARGLFHRAIPQSGAASNTLPLDRAVRAAEQFLDILGLGAGDVNALRSLTVEQLLASQQDLVIRALGADSEIGSTMPMQPVVDGKTLPLMPLEAIAGGSADGVPILVGSTLDEWKLFSMMDPGLATLDEAGLLKRCGSFIPADDVQGFVEAYRNARAKRGASTTPGELFMAIQTDRVFRMPAIRLAEIQHRRGQPAYNYLFTWCSPLLDGVLGACHALELGFLFGNYEETFSGSGPAAEALARSIQDAWLAFAHTGDPSCESIGAWPTYGGSRETMILGEKCKLAQAPYDEERRVWDSVSNAAIGSL